MVRGENQQLEDMLHEAEQRSSAEQASIAKLSADLTALQREQEGLVSSAAANAAAQDAHIGRLQAELEASTRQVAALQAELQAAQEQHAQALSSKDSMEGGAMEGGFECLCLQVEAVLACAGPGSSLQDAAWVHMQRAEVAAQELGSDAADRALLSVAAAYTRPLAAVDVFRPAVCCVVVPLQPCVLRWQHTRGS